VKVKSPGKCETLLIVVREENHHLLRGSQASPSRPSDKGSVKENTSEWLEAVAAYRIENTASNSFSIIFFKIRKSRLSMNVRKTERKIKIWMELTGYCKIATFL
jgi:hypothetical protein